MKSTIRLGIGLSFRLGAVSEARISIAGCATRFARSLDPPRGLNSSQDILGVDHAATT